MISGENGHSAAKPEQEAHRTFVEYEDIRNYLNDQLATIHSDNELLISQTSEEFAEPKNRFEIIWKQAELAGKMHELELFAKFIDSAPKHSNIKQK